MNKLKDFISYIRGKKSGLNTGRRNFPMKRSTAITITVIFTILVYFIFLPAINLHSRETWLFLMAIQFLLILLAGKTIPGLKTRLIILVGMIGIYLVLNLTSIELFTAKKYSRVINIEEGNFTQEIKEPSLDQIPTLDRDSSQKVGSRKMGELLDLVSQFDIDDNYSQVNYKDRPVRTTPLRYNGILKYLFNFREGLPGYMNIDIVNGRASLVKLKEGIKYSHGDILLRNIRLYARLKYPFEIFNEYVFEIDENGTPFWIIPTYKNRVGFFGAYDVKKVITINAINGKSTIYPVEKAPKWIDRVYDSDKIIQQLDWAGKYKLGFFNSKLAQKQVLQTTEGYNYLALNDDIYLYTGYTSVAGDESNVGFILSNLRTKETKFYPISSAKEVSAMESAEGAVQEKKYKATFPLLFNIKGQPTYFLSLKDNAGLIKQYAFIDAQDFQRVSVGSNVQEAYNKHTGQVESKDNDKGDEEDKGEVLEKKARIEDIYSVVIKGNSHYYFTLEGDTSVYVSAIQVYEKLPFLKNGDHVLVKYRKVNGSQSPTNKVVNMELVEEKTR